MLEAALLDLHWRRRRFLIAVVGVGMLLAMTLVLTGVSNGFDLEAEDTLAALDVDTWIVQEDAPGPFVAQAPISAALVDEVPTSDAVQAVAPFIFGRQSLRQGTSIEDVNVFGAAADEPGMPQADEGRRPAVSGEIMVSTALGLPIGDSIRLGPTTFEVVGSIPDSTAFGGAPNVFMLASDAQAVVFNGAPAVSAIGVNGVPESVPEGTTVFDNAAALDDLTRMLEQGSSGIRFLTVLLWLVAGMIIGAVLYMTALERIRDFAIYKAVGVSSRGILGGLVAQAAILAVAAAVIGCTLSVLLAPRFPMRVDIPPSAYALLILLAVVVGALGSIAAVRRVLHVDPALAFNGP
jgi:putative ABC transport system permease protein